MQQTTRGREGCLLVLGCLSRALWRGGGTQVLAGCFRSTFYRARPSGDSPGGTKATLNFSWGLVRSQPGVTD
jgi:hypothetical protein